MVRIIMILLYDDNLHTCLIVWFCIFNLFCSPLLVTVQQMFPETEGIPLAFVDLDCRPRWGRVCLTWWPCSGCGGVYWCLWWKGLGVSQGVSSVAVFFPFVQRCNFDWTSQQHPKTHILLKNLWDMPLARMSWGGMLIFALLLSLITSAFEDFLWQIRHGSIPVVEGRHALVFLASGMTGESETQANVDKIENIITWHVENTECDIGPFAMEHVSTCPFCPGDSEWIDEWMDCEGAFTLRSSLSLGDHIVILGYDRSAIWMIEDPWWAKCG